MKISNNGMQQQQMPQQQQQWLVLQASHSKQSMWDFVYFQAISISFFPLSECMQKWQHTHTQIRSNNDDNQAN